MFFAAQIHVFDISDPTISPLYFYFDDYGLLFFTGSQFHVFSQELSSGLRLAYGSEVVQEPTHFFQIKLPRRSNWQIWRGILMFG